MFEGMKTVHGLPSSPNELGVIGNRVYAFCIACGSLVQINKPLIGSTHLCG